MDRSVTVKLRAYRQALDVEAPPVIASGIIDLFKFEVETSQEWDGLETSVLVRFASGDTLAFPVQDGAAQRLGVEIRDVGGAIVALYGRDGEKSLTTEAKLIFIKKGL